MWPGTCVLRLTGEMTAEWLHLPPPYPPGVGPLCGAELEAWYEDLQDILGSDTGGAKLARAPVCTEVSSSTNEKAITPMMSVSVCRPLCLLIFLFLHAK